MEERFKTDTTALKQRIQAHETYGSYDLNGWIRKHLQLSKGLSILDLGCGIGKQILPLAQVIGETGHVLAVDVAKEALDIVALRSKELGLEKRISLLCIGMDNLGGHLPEQYFDRVLSSYALYYAEQPRSVFEVTHRSLKTGGILFFCGPAKDNNYELRRFHYALRGERPPAESKVAAFMEETGQQLSREFFDQVKVFTFQNPLRFDSPDALYAYWSSYNLYNENLDRDFKIAVAKHFQSQPVFETVKRVIGIRAVK
jgi:ubiquinone/menaquinone biosynthesis C-methylase UbiE